MNLSRYWLTYFLSYGIVSLYPLQGFTQQSSEPGKSVPDSALEAGSGQHDFDFEIGTWKTHVRRLLHPLSGSTTWTDYVGRIVVNKVWNGRANLGELEADGPTGHLEGLSLRLYDPQSHQWSLNFASSADGTLSQPTIGEFRNGIGEFYDMEPFKGRLILVRSVFSDVTPNSFRSEQAFSNDGGKTWEVNLIETDTRTRIKSDISN